MARIKRSDRLLYQLIAIGTYGAVHAFWTALLLFIIGGPWIKGAFLVFEFHFIIDTIRSRMEMNWFGIGRVYVTRHEFMARLKEMRKDHEGPRKPISKKFILINILDQVTHLLSLYAISIIV